MTKSELKKQNKLQRILSAASQLFADSDFHQVCMDEIAQRAGVGKGTLYNLFESKDDLYLSIIRIRLTELLGLLELFCATENESMKNLRSLVLHLHDFMSQHNYFYSIWKREQNTINGSDAYRPIRDLQDRIFELVVRVLSGGEREGIVRPSLNNRLVARLFLGMIDALRKEPPGAYGQEAEIDELIEVLMRGIGCENDREPMELEDLRHGGRVEEW